MDFSVFGVVPLEIYLLNGNTNLLALGLNIADKQWEDPLPDGLTRETRWWVDDAFMIGSLQIQAYRATHDAKYADHVATQLAAYLDRLQQPNGLFHHGPEAPFYWARGNGWVAAALAEVLQSLPTYASAICAADGGLPENDGRAEIRPVAVRFVASIAGRSAIVGGNLWHRHVHLRDDRGREARLARRGDMAVAPGAAGLRLCGKIDAQGNLEDICVGTNQSRDKQFYLDRPRSTGDLHGQAPVLWCAWALVEK